MPSRKKPGLKTYRAKRHFGVTAEPKGKVVRKYVKNNIALVDIEIAAENQRGEVTTPGIATVALDIGQVGPAIRLLGAAAALRERSGGTVWPAERGRLARTAAARRSAK